MYVVCWDRHRLLNSARGAPQKLRLSLIHLMDGVTKRRWERVRSVGNVPEMKAMGLCRMDADELVSECLSPSLSIIIPLLLSLIRTNFR